MSIQNLAREWLRLDKNPSTRAEVEKLLKEDIAELSRRMAPRIAFGTAGLRARMEAGFSRMNDLTVIQTSHGLAQYLLDHVPAAAKAGVVIGFDGRHHSKRFAEVAAATFHAKGIKVWWYGDLVHTPMVPFGVKHLRAAAGIMITASHNPKHDNGYKVYGQNGCQINTPIDNMISESILHCLEPPTWDTTVISTMDRCSDYLVPKYLDKTLDLVSIQCNNLPRFVYTPLHGVGLYFMEATVKSVLARYGTGNDRGSGHVMNVVGLQSQPDPEFSTVQFPNPEEKGALDLAKGLADEKGIKLVLANDPDADRFAVAEKVGSEWHQLTGDQVGILLVYWMLQKNKSLRKLTMLTSAVSSQMLSVIAEKEGFTAEETLTGFKWIGNRALDIGDHAVFGYEEALGYMPTKIVHDKDGVAAAILFLEACSHWTLSPYMMLQSLYQRYGFFETVNTYWKCTDSNLAVVLFENIRTDKSLPILRRLERFRDVTRSFDTAYEDHKARLPMTPDTQMLTFWFSGNGNDDGIRFTIRGSGTEPKIKIYLECRSNNRESARTGALETLKVIRSTWFADARLEMEKKYKVDL